MPGTWIKVTQGGKEEFINTDLAFRIQNGTTYGSLISFLNAEYSYQTKEPPEVIRNRIRDART